MADGWCPLQPFARILHSLLKFLSDYVSRPNPYNKGTGGNRFALKDTMKDGMIKLLCPRTAGYMGIALSMTMARLFYNKTLYAKLHRQYRSAETFENFIDACEKIKRHKFYTAKQRSEMGKITAAIELLKKRFRRASSGKDKGSLAQLEARLAALNGMPRRIYRCRFAIPLCPVRTNRCSTTLPPKCVNPRTSITTASYPPLSSISLSKTKKLVVRFRTDTRQFDMVRMLCSNSRPGSAIEPR